MHKNKFSIAKMVIVIFNAHKLVLFKSNVFQPLITWPVQKPTVWQVNE